MKEVALIEQRLFDEEVSYHARLRAEEEKSPSPELNDGEPWVCAVAEVFAVKTHPLRYNLAVVIDQLAAATVKIQQLETRLAEAEKRGLEYKGVHQKAQTYKRGDVCTYSGSAYIAIKDVGADGEAPNASAGWALLVQRGRDAAGRNR